MVLMEYLTETSVSPLQARFVESDQPLASEVGYSLIENKESCVYLMFQNVPKDKIPQVGPELKKVLQELVNGTIVWDRSRMSTVIQRRISQQMSQMENTPHDAVAFMAIGDMLYGNRSEDLRVRLNSVEDFAKLANEPDNFWIEMIDQMFLNSPRVLVMGIPSRNLQQNMRREEEQRIKDQKNKLGEDGLKKREVEMEESMAKNEEEAPGIHLLEKVVEVPSVLVQEKIVEVEQEQVFEVVKQIGKAEYQERVKQVQLPTYTPQ